jgi:hypothetical protein
VPNLSGPKLEAMVEELKEWAVDYKLKLHMRLKQGGYPYGAVKLNDTEQFARFMEMRGQDYEALVANLNAKYLGHPQAYNMVNKELADFMYAMVGIALKKMGVDNAG